MSYFYFYKIQTGQDKYVGKTKDINRRLKAHQHRTNLANYEKVKLYETINKNGGWDSVSTEVLYVGEMDNVESMEMERQLIEEHNCNLNNKLPGKKRFNQTYYQRHKEELRAKAREKYVKTKKEYKHPPRTKEQLRQIALYRIKKTKRPPTDLTIEKYELTAEEIEECLA